MIGGTRFDVKFGTPLEDDFFTSSNHCDDLCYPAPTALLCTVDPATAIGSQNFHTLAAAIAECLFDVIAIVPAVHYENLITSMKYTSRNTASLTILSYNGAIIEGFHIINQDCLISDLVPQTLIFKDLIFRSPTSNLTSVPPISILDIRSEAFGVCNLPVVKIQTSTFILTNASHAGFFDAITCHACSVGTLTLQTLVINGAFKNGFYINSDSSPIVPHVVISQITVAPTAVTGMIGYLNNGATTSTFSISQVIGNCENTAPYYGCLYVSGGNTYTPHALISNQIHANDAANSTITKYSAIVWNLEGSFTLAQVRNILNATTGNVATATRFGLHIISNGINIEYPCVEGADATIIAIKAANLLVTGNDQHVEITDQNGIIIDLIDTNSPRTRCFAIKDIPSGSDLVIPIMLVAMVAFIIGFTICCLWGRCLQIANGISRGLAPPTDTPALKRNQQEYKLLRSSKTKNEQFYK